MYIITLSVLQVQVLLPTVSEENGQINIIISIIVLCYGCFGLSLYTFSP